MKIKALQVSGLSHITVSLFVQHRASEYSEVAHSTSYILHKQEMMINLHQGSKNGWYVVIHTKTTTWSLLVNRVINSCFLFACMWSKRVSKVRLVTQEGVGWCESILETIKLLVILKGNFKSVNTSFLIKVLSMKQTRLSQWHKS